MYLGPDALRKVIETAELYPIRGLFSFSDFFHEIDSYYHRNHGFELGVSTGWKALDELYNVRIMDLHELIPLYFSFGKIWLTL